MSAFDKYIILSSINISFFKFAVILLLLITKLVVLFLSKTIKLLAINPTIRTTISMIIIKNILLKIFES